MPNYYIRERRDLNHEGQTLQTYEVRSRGNVNLSELVHQVRRNYRTISEGELLDIAEKFIEEMQAALAEGYSVTFGQLGNFSLRIGLSEEARKLESHEESIDDELNDTPQGQTETSIAKAFDKGKRHNSRSLCVKGLRYAPDKTFIHKLDSRCHLTSEGAGYQSLHYSPYLREERIARAIEFLHTHPFMRLSDYVNLTGLSRTAASTELRELSSDPDVPIRSDGKRAAKVYVLNGE